jgi:hypothetical protein
MDGSSPPHLLRPHKLTAGLGHRRDSNGSYASSTGSGSFKHSWRGIIASTWRLGGAVFLTCLVTLAIFPGFLAEDVSVSAAVGGWVIAGRRLTDVPGSVAAASACRRQGPVADTAP